MKAEELDRRFDAGEDMSKHMIPGTLRRPNQEARRVNVDFPGWMVDALDREARHLGISRQAVIKVWIGERLESVAKATEPNP